MKKRVIKLILALCVLLAILSMSVMAVAAGNKPYLEVTRNDRVFTVTPKNAPNGSAVYFASYAEDGQLLDAEIWTVNAENYAFTAPEGVHTAKAFLIDATTQKPLCEVGEPGIKPEEPGTEPEQPGGQQQIPSTVFDFGEPEIYTFKRVTIQVGDQYPVVPKQQSAVYQFVKEIGATYKEKDFQFKYKRQGNDTYETELPSNAGTYDVTVTRAADATYAAFEHTYENVLVINKGVHANMTNFTECVSVFIANRGYTWFEFDWSSIQYDKPSEGATFTYYVSADKVTWYRSEEGSNRVSVPEYMACDWNVRVQITNDPNYEDWTSSIYSDCYGTPYQLLPYPTTFWSDQWDGKDTSWVEWFDLSKTDQIITKPEHLAALSILVNDGVTFEGQNISLGEDIDLSGYKWVPIGTATKPFKGNFDGQSYTISNLYINGDPKYAGLFGYTEGTDTTPAQIKNVTLKESQIAGLRAAECVGSIVAYANNTEIVNCYSSTYVTSNKDSVPVGGIVGLGNGVRVINCVNEGKVESMGYSGGIVGQTTGSASNLSYIYGCTSTTALNGYKSAGGIVGNLNWAQVDACYSYGSILGNTSGGTGGIVGVCSGNMSEIANCLNYSAVSTTGSNWGAGGIVGIVNAGKVYNCANTIEGSVKAYNSVGGIVGLNNADGHVYNCYSAGTVKGSAKGTNWLGIGDGMYTGAVVGRNKDNKGYVTNCYYRAGSAKNYSGDASGAGTPKGSSNSEKHLSIGWFSNWVSNVESNWYGSDKAPLIDILNRWQGDYVNNGYGLAMWWVPSADEYPVPHK